MARSIEDIQNLREYLVGVMEKAGHHAGEVECIALALAGAVVWRATGEIKAIERDGKMANALWITIGDNRYALSYRHEVRAIEIREKNLQGRTLMSFDNSTPIAEVKNFFEGL